jgi:hypothetical protein
MNSPQLSVKLIIHNGPTAGQTVVVDDLPRVIGRGTGVDIHIPDQTLSRQHARVRATDRGLMVEDLGSTNGTFVNGQKISRPTLCRSGDTLRVGDLITLEVQAGRSHLDHMATIAEPAGHDFTPTARPAPAAVAPPSGSAPGGMAWLAMVSLVLLAAVIVGGGLLFLYYTRAAQPAAVQPSPVPPPTQAPPTETPTATPLPPEPGLTTPAAVVPTVRVPGIAAAAAQERSLPAGISTQIDPFCNDTVEIDADKPVVVSWFRQTAAPAETDYPAEWLNAVYFDLTIDGHPITDRGTFNYYRSAGPTLTWWVNVGLLEPGSHYLRAQWYTNRKVSSGLDQEPLDGQPDYFGPGAAGDGYCQLVVPQPVAAVTPTASPTPAPPASPTPPSTPTTAPVPVAVGPAPLGVFQDFEKTSAWQRGDQPYGTLTRASDQIYSGSFAGRLDYNFPTGSNDYVVFMQSRALAGQPEAITAWVFGDGRGHYLNLWVKDAGGQTWQFTFGQVKHTGWRELTAMLNPAQPWPVGHISGPNNGAVEYPVSFQALVLDDAPDSFSGSGAIYLDDLASRVGVTAPPAPPQVNVTSVPVNTGPYRLAVGKHIYEPWGAPAGGDVCEAYRQKAFDDKVVMKGFNLELLLTNNSTVPVADDWAPDFITAKGRSPQVCYYGYKGSGPQPGATTSMTFFTIIEPDDTVRVVQLNINGQLSQICLNTAGAEAPCQ